MKFKQEEKKRKANEEKEAQIRAQKERERRLKVNKKYIYCLFITFHVLSVY